MADPEKTITAQQGTARPPQPGLSIFADFNEDGELKLDASDHDARETGLGAIILADLDANDRTLPTAATTGPPQALDADAQTHDPKDPELLPFTVTPIVGTPTVNGGVDISGVMSNRFRVLDASGAELKTGLRLDRYFTTWSGARTDLLLIVNGLPGSPLARGERPLLETDVPKPRPTSPPDATESTVRVTIFSGNGKPEDTGLVTVAPLLLMHNLLEPERIYIAEQPGNLGGTTPSAIDGNQPTLADLESELKAVSGVALVKVPLSANNGDAWLQDQLQVGYCHAPSGALRMVCHLPRMVKNVTHTTADVNNLAGFVESHFPSRGVGLFRDFWNRTFFGQDASGKDFFVPFTDTYATFMAMLRVFNFRRMLIPMLAGSGIRFDDPGSYSGARLQLEPLFVDVKAILKAKIAVARAAGATATVTALQSTEADIDRLKADVDRDTPLRGSVSSRHFGIPVPTQVELTKDQVDKVEARLSLTHDSTNYGGNLVASPPISGAKLGKIVVGSNPNRPADPDFIYFLRAQGKQPLVEIDTSWLDVGHADELVTFVPRPKKDPNFAILHASPSLAMALVRAALEAWKDGIPTGPFGNQLIRNTEILTGMNDRNMTRQKNATTPVTHMLRGKLWLHSQLPGSFNPVMPPRIYQRLVDLYNVGFLTPNRLPFKPGSGPDRFYPANLNVVEMISFGGDTNDAIDNDHITELRGTLGPAFPGVAMLELPVLFDIPVETRTSSFTPDIVNLQVLGEHIFMPRPYGPRMLHAQAIDVVKSVVSDRPDRTGDLGKEMLAQLAKIDVKRLSPTVHWANGGDDGGSDPNRDPRLDQFADGFPVDFDGRPQHTERIIARNPKEFDKGQLRPQWHRLVIPEGKLDGKTGKLREPVVDIFELYVEALMGALGLELHWVDSWYYHVRFGELHCGTNVLRKPKLDPKWWQV